MPSFILMTVISFCLSDRCSGKVDFLAHLRTERSIAQKEARLCYRKRKSLESKSYAIKGCR